MATTLSTLPYPPNPGNSLFSSRLIIAAESPHVAQSLLTVLFGLPSFPGPRHAFNARTSTPAPSNAFRTASAIRSAPGVSP